MEYDLFRWEVKKILKHNIRFDGHIKKVIESIEDNKTTSILEWIKNCKENKEKYEPCKKNQNLIAFIYKSNDNRIRGILSKEKNKYFIELFLDKHKYYDNKRKYLGI